MLDLWDGTLRGRGRFRQFSRSCCQDAREDPIRGRSHPPSSWGLRSFYRILAPVLTPDIPGHEARARQDPFFRPGLSRFDWKNFAVGALVPWMLATLVPSSHPRVSALDPPASRSPFSFYSWWRRVSAAKYKVEALPVQSADRRSIPYVKGRVQGSGGRRRR